MAGIRRNGPIKYSDVSQPDAATINTKALEDRGIKELIGGMKKTNSIKNVSGFDVPNYF